MRPKTYCKFSCQCQNCKFIAMSTPTSFMILSAIRDLWSELSDSLDDFP